MGQNSKIEWTMHTFNPWRGCTKVSAGCASCYAEKQAKRNPGVLGVWGDNGTRVIASESYWKQPLAWDRAAKAAGERHRVFCASMADVFEDRDELEGPRARLFELTSRTPNLDWLLLTKRPQNIGRMWDGRRCVAQNIWLGTSVENQKAADERIAHLVFTEPELSPVRFLSVEPLLGQVKLNLDGIDWVIVGGESGTNARPMHPQWARSVRDQCVSAGVPFFFKQWGEWKPISEMPSAEHEALYVSNRIADEGSQQCEFDEVYGKRCKVQTAAVRFDGKSGQYEYEAIDGHLAYQAFRVGKKAAGRLLDGRTWDEMPEVTR